MNNSSGFCNIESSFRQAMADAGLTFAGEIVADSGLQRFTVEGDHGPHGWYVLYTDGVPAGVYGCNKRGIEAKWSAKPESEFTKEEKAAYRQRMADAKAKRDADQAKRQAAAAALAQTILDAAQPATATDDHLYLTRKLVSAYAGVRVGDWPQRQAVNALLIPFSIDGRLTTIEAIAETGSLIGDSGKDWLAGGLKRGASFQIGDVEQSELLSFCEGYSTGASVHEATCFPMVVCGDAGNLIHVAKSYRAKYANKRFVFAADNDLGKDTNTGLNAASTASQAVSGVVVVPDFTEKEIESWKEYHDGKYPTDFNDLRIIRGLAGVKAVFDAALVAINDEPATSPPLKDSLLVNVDDKGHSSLIQHNEAAEILYREEFNSLLYYHALTCYWYEYQPSGIFSIRPDLAIQQSVYLAINRHCGDLGFSSSYVSGVAKCLLLESVREPQTPSGLICFLNGALELESRKLLEHSPKYFFTSQLPFDWQPKAPDPKLVIDWLLESVGGHHDQVELIRAYANAIILGRYNLQRFLEVVGPGGSGKSTLIRLFTAMVGNKSVYSTQLKELETNRFETANLFGKKLVVINDAEKWHSDISTLKNITGGDNVKFEEKNKQSDVNFVYSGMVVIAANQRTGSNDYSSAIQRRRITIEFNHVVAADKRRDLDSEFEPLLPSVVRWALDMPNSEVIAYIRSTPIRVKSLQSVSFETLIETNPVIGWLSECVKFDENAFTQIGVKEKLTKTTGGRDEEKTTRHEYKHWDKWLYPNYCRWCDHSGKQPVASRSFASAVTDCAKNLLDKPFVKWDRKAQGAMIIGVELCCNNAGFNAVYPTDYDRNVGYAALKESEDYENRQAESHDDPATNSGVSCDETQHKQHSDNNQPVKQHIEQHESSIMLDDDGVKPVDDDDVEYF